MIISSSTVDMSSRRTFAAMQRGSASLSTWGVGGSDSRFFRTASDAAQSVIHPDEDNEKQQTALADSSGEELRNRFSQTRSIRANSLEGMRSLRTLNLIRRHSISYLLQQLFGQSSRDLFQQLYQTDPAQPQSGTAQFQTGTTQFQSGTLQSGTLQSPSDPALLLTSARPVQAYGGQLTYWNTYSEMENTNFSTQGKVVTASGREINFNLELSMSRSFYESASNVVDFGAPKLTDPLVINLDSDVASVSDQKFYFDLDADGHEEYLSQLNSGSGFLALDKNKDGRINDGSELFGTASGNGFADLAAYDSDGNGWIDEADEIFDQLLIWQKDAQGNDVLRGLGAAGIGAIYLGNIATPFSMNSSTDNHTDAVVRQTGVFLYENGNSGTVQQLDLAAQEASAV